MEAIQPRTAGQLLDHGWVLTKRHWGDILMLGIGPVVVASGIDLLNEIPAKPWWIEGVTFCVGITLYGLAEGRMATGTWLMALGNPNPAAQARALVRQRAVAVVLVYGIKWILLLFGLLALVLPGLWLIVRLFAIPVATVVEQRSAFDSWRRSWRLSRGSGSRLLLSVGFLDLVWFAVSITVFGLMGGFSESPNPYASLASIAAVLPLLPYRMSVQALAYLDCRVRTEGYDLDVALSLQR